MSDVTFSQVNDTIQKYLKERDWDKNTSRGLAISIALEANELLEHYQWSEKPVGDKKDIAEELADIIIYAFQFASTNDIDIPSAMFDKLDKVATKYPADMFKGKSTEDQDKAWLENKLKHTKKSL